MIDDKFMKRVQSAVSRGSDKTISLSEVREYVYQDTTKPESTIVRELIDQVKSTSGVLANVKDEVPSKPALDTVPGLPTNKGGNLSTTQKGKALSVGGNNQIDLLKATEKNFTNESEEVKSAIVGHLTQQTIRSAKDLKQALEKIRNTELALFRQIYSDHSAVRRSELSALTGALSSKQQQEEIESSNFQQQLDLELSQLCQQFGVSGY